MGFGARDPHSARAQAFAQQWDVPVLGTYEDVIAADVDAVYNPSRTMRTSRGARPRCAPGSTP